MGHYNPYAYTSPQGPMHPAASPPTGAPQHWEVGEVVGHAWSMFKPAWPTLVFSQLLTSVLGGVPNYVPGIAVATRAVEHGSGGYWTLYAICFVVALVLGTFFTGGMIKIWCAAARGQTPQFGDMFAGAARFLPMLAGTFLMLLAVLLGYALLIVPGIILALGLGFTTFFIADQNMGPIDAMKASWEATKGHKGKIFVFGMLAFLMALGGYVACCVGVFVALPVIMVAWATIYTRLTGTTGHGGGDGAMQPPTGGFGYGGAPGPYGPSGPAGYGPPGGGGGHGPPGYGPPPAGGFGGG